MPKYFLAALVPIVSIYGFTAKPAQAEVRLPNVFGSHMVLQRDKPLVVWGWADANEKITVKLAGQSVAAQANAKGEWKATLRAVKASSEPTRLEVAGSTTV